MTESSEFELLELATPYALDAVSENERAAIETHIAAGPRRCCRTLRRRGSPRPGNNGRRLGLDTGRTAGGSTRAAAGIRQVRLGALSAGLALRSTAPLSTPAQVFAADDVRTVSGAMPAGGTATVVYSREKNAGVLVMNNVPPPSSGTVYQMWLMGDNGAKLAGTMDAKAVAPSTTAVIREIGKSNALAFLVEPSPGSTRPNCPVIADCL